MKAQRIATASETPQRMRAGQRRVATQRDLDRGREPAQGPIILQGPQIGRLRVTELERDVLHPSFLGGSIEQANGRRIAGERTRRERIDEMEERHVFSRTTRRSRAHGAWFAGE